MPRSNSRGRQSTTTTSSTSYKKPSRSTSKGRKGRPSQKFSPTTIKIKDSSPPSLRKSKSPQKTLKDSKGGRLIRSSSRSRKVNTAPPGVVTAKKKKEKPGSRPISPQSFTSIKTTTITTATRVRPATASPLPTTPILRGSISPPVLRSRTAAAAAAAINNQRGPTHSPSILKRRMSYTEQIKNSGFSQQLGKFGNSIKKVTYSIANKAKNNWKLLLLLLLLLILIGSFYKFNKELVQINKQFVDFVKEHYTQQRHIFGHVWIKFKNVSNFVWNEYFISLKNNLKKIYSSHQPQPPKIKLSTTTTPKPKITTTTQIPIDIYNNEDEF